MSVTLCIDIGGHGARAVVVRDRAVMAIAAADYPAPPPIRRHSAELWGVLKECVRRLPADIRGEIAAVAVTGVRGAVIGLAEDGVPVTPLYPDFDEAAVGPARTLAERIGASFLAETGCPLFPLAGLPKMLLQAGQPIRRWLGAQDYVAFLLTGRMAVSTGSALRLGVLDRAGASLNRRILTEAGVEPDTIPPLVPVGEVVGLVAQPAAAQLDLPEGAPVVACPGDVPAGFVAAGTELRVAFANLGTTTVVCLLAVAFPAGAAALTHEILDRGRRSCGTGFGAGGVTFDWLSRFFGLPLGNLEQEAAAASLSSVVVQPELLSAWGARAAGAIFDIAIRDGRAEIVRAAYRSVAGRLIDALGELDGIVGPADTLVLGGGGASSDLLCEEIARLWKGSLQRLPRRELAAEGAASVASRAARRARATQRDALAISGGGVHARQ